MDNKESKGGLNKSLKLIFVYTVATGSIFTFVNYWDSVFYGYCGSGDIPRIRTYDCSYFASRTCI